MIMKVGGTSTSTTDENERSRFEFEILQFPNDFNFPAPSGK